MGGAPHPFFKGKALGTRLVWRRREWKRHWKLTLRPSFNVLSIIAPRLFDSFKSREIKLYMKKEDRVRTQNDTLTFIVLLFLFFRELKIY